MKIILEEFGGVVVFILIALCIFVNYANLLIVVTSS